MEKKRPKPPDEGLAKFGIIAGCAMMIIPLFASRLDLGERLLAPASGLMGFYWGMSRVAAAKKWRQQYGEPTSEERMEIKKSHSISNLPLLLMWIVFGIAALLLLGLVFDMLFHHGR